MDLGELPCLLALLCPPYGLLVFIAAIIAAKTNSGPSTQSNRDDRWNR